MEDDQWVDDGSPVVVRQLLLLNFMYFYCCYVNNVLLYNIVNICDQVAWLLVTSYQFSIHPVSPKLREELGVIVFTVSAVILFLGSASVVMRLFQKQ
jgi:hypothetical protein